MALHSRREVRSRVRSWDGFGSTVQRLGHLRLQLGRGWRRTRQPLQRDELEAHEAAAHEQQQDRHVAKGEGRCAAGATLRSGKRLRTTQGAIE
jgi:hypothetical protein